MPLTIELGQRVKSLFRKNELVRRFYYTWIFHLTDVPFAQWFRPRKLWLILNCRSYTYMPWPRLSIIYDLAVRTSRDRLMGSYVECGVCNGGSGGVLGGISRRSPNRHVWLFDSWEGLPEPDSVDVDLRDVPGRTGMALGQEERARELLLDKLGLTERTVHFMRGWFDDTLPPNKAQIGPIALLHLDCDWYKSVKFCLEQLYDQVITGGYVVIDDYGHWQGCRKAVDEFIEQRQLQVSLTSVDYTGVYFQKM
jgi:O-methyltransferase